jgi:hypothetical protein
MNRFVTIGVQVLCNVPFFSTKKTKNKYNGNGGIKITWLLMMMLNQLKNKIKISKFKL